jgi:hypothetical protein
MSRLRISRRDVSPNILDLTIQENVRNSSSLMGPGLLSGPVTRVPKI